MIKKIKKKHFLLFALGWILMEAVYSTGVIRLIVDESFSVNKIEVGQEGKVLAQIDGTLNWIDSPIIKSDKTLNVPSDFSTISDAFDYLGDKKIASDAIVTIKLADGVYNHTATLEPKHPDGRNIEIIGNTSTPSAVIINAGTRFFKLSNSTIKLIDGITIDGGGTASDCFYILTNSSLSLGSAIVIEGFVRAIAVETNSVMVVDGITINNSAGYPIRVADNAFLDISNSTITNTSSYVFHVLRSSYARSVNNTISSYSGPYAYNIGRHSLLELSGGSVSAALGNISPNSTSSANNLIRTF